LLLFLFKLQNAPVRLQQYSIILPIVQTLQCNAADVHNGRVQATMLCAGTLGGSTNAVCNGNQGGGLFCAGHLSGVLSFGINCGVANNPAVFIDVRQYNNWINEQFTRNDIPQPGSVTTP
jgi:secreted trypsin-like serine protease